jgi:hypothetical protein
MKRDKRDNGATTGTSITPMQSSAADRICSQCSLALPWTGAGGALEACWCEYCARNVKPEFRAAHERALAFRNTLRELLKLKALPDKVLEEIRTCWQRDIWTHLRGSDGQSFKTFDDFCSDPLGLGCEPAPVKALLEQWVGATALALAITPVAQPGRRTDRVKGTCRRTGEKSRPRRTDTRHRTIHSGPKLLATAVGRRLVGKMNAEFLVGYGKKYPNCERFAALMRQIEEGLAADAAADHVSMRMACSNQVQALREGMPATLGGGKKRRNDPQTRPVIARGKALSAPTTTADRMLAGGEDAPACASLAMQLSAPECARGAESSTTTELLAPVVTQGRVDTPTVPDVSERRGLLVGLLRAWRPIVALVGDGPELRVWLELLESMTADAPCVGDDELYARLTVNLRVSSSAATPSATNALVCNATGSERRDAA